MHFFIHMNPPTVTHQEKKVTVRNGKPVIYEPTELKEARRDLLEAVVRFRPAAPYTGAVRLMVKWCFPRGAHGNGEYKTSKPDTDNLDKLLKDVMTEAGYWIDDAQVAREQIEKFWADVPGIYVEVDEIG